MGRNPCPVMISFLWRNLPPLFLRPWPTMCEGWRSRFWQGPGAGWGEETLATAQKTIGRREQGGRLCLGKGGCRWHLHVVDYLLLEVPCSAPWLGLPAALCRKLGPNTT